MIKQKLVYTHHTALKNRTLKKNNLEVLPVSYPLNFPSPHAK